MVREASADSTDSVIERIDSFCDEFDAACRRGESPTIGGVLERVREADRPALFLELLLIELEYRQKAGETVGPDSYRSEFPRFAELVDQAFTRDEPATHVKPDGNALRFRVLQVGMHIAHFELREQIGAGAMGAVWKAWDSKLRRDVALKLPRRIR